MIRKTTREAYNSLKESNLLSPMRLRVWRALVDYCEENDCFETKLFPTATELARFMNITRGAQSNQNVCTRLGELRDSKMVFERPDRKCSKTGFSAATWEPIPEDSPLKYDKPQIKKCPTCKGSGIIKEIQARLF
jgi:hypothetical protein